MGHVLTGAAVLLLGAVVMPVSPASAQIVLSIIKVGEDPSAMAFNPAGTFAYVTYRDSDSVSKINLATSVSNTTVTMPASAKVLAAYANLTVANGSTILLRVASSSIKVCKVSGASLNVINSGSCKVRVTVKPKVGKSVSKMVTLDVTK